MTAQDGVISREQALALGSSPMMIRRLHHEERWTPLGRGVYTDRDEPGFRQRAWAGHLRAGDFSALGGEAALCLKGVRPEPGMIQMVVPQEARRELPYGYVLLRDCIGRLEHRRGTLPCVRPEDAILDLAGGLSLEGFVGVVTDATRERLTTAKRIETVLRARGRMPDRERLLGVLGDLQGIESNLEYIYRRDVERAHGLPAGRRQVTGRAGRMDLWYEDYGVIIEVDGKKGHQEGRFRDYNRDNEHAANLATTLRYGGYDIRGSACGVARQVGRTLELRGWPEVLAQCPHCLGRGRVA